MKINYFMPTKIIMAKNCIIENSEVFKTLGKRAIIVTGKTSAKKNGALLDVTNALEQEGLEYFIYDKVVSNPTVDCVYEGVALAKSMDADMVIAIGGGSPMDAAKAIALLKCQDIEKENFFCGKYENRALPMAFVPTTAGTGSEVTQYSIINNDVAKTKTNIVSPSLFPKVALLDAKYLLGLSQETSINTALDALSHSIEGLLSVKSDVVSKMVAVEGIKNIAQCFNNLITNDLSVEVREKLLYASLLGGIVIAQTGTTSVHALGYSLTYFKHVDHGRANALVMIEYLKLIQAKYPEIIKTILEAAGLESLSCLKEVFDDLLGNIDEITLDEAKMFASIAIKARNISNGIVAPDEAQLLDIYMNSLRIK